MEEDFAADLSNAQKEIDSAAASSPTGMPEESSAAEMATEREGAKYDAKCRKYRDKHGHFLPNPTDDCAHGAGKAPSEEVSLDIIGNPAVSPQKSRRRTFKSDDSSTAAFAAAVERLAPNIVRIGKQLYFKESLFRGKEAAAEARIKAIEDKCRLEVEAFRTAVENIAREDAKGVCELTSKVLQMCENTTFVIGRAKFWRSLSMLLTVLLLSFLATFMYTKWQQAKAVAEKSDVAESSEQGGR